MSLPEYRRALLDTSVVIDFPAGRLADIADEVAISAVTMGELQYGVTAAADPLEQMYRRRRVDAALGLFEVLPFDVGAAEYYGTLATLVRQHGRNPRPRRLDLQIAATAARNNLMLVTRNGRDFTGLETALTVVDLGEGSRGHHPDS